ncbi:MAG: phosphoenolpyruvate--protein phosphotransferase [Ruminococcus sp.]|nr:phosphoenolpyruvate--protein phosphotransferase [Ruminococcus sp.]
MNDTISGKPISGGIAIGRIHYYDKNKNAVKWDTVTDIHSELQRYEAAKRTALLQLKELNQKAAQEIGAESASIFEGQAMILEDTDYNTFAREMISNQSSNAEYAVFAAGEKFSSLFAVLEDEYFKERAIDIKDVSQRMLSVLAKQNSAPRLCEPCIIMAEELTPGETVHLEKEMLLGFATERGSAYSHTAILAGIMNIPAISEVAISEGLHGKLVILDGYSGRLIVDPDEDTLAFYKERKKREEDRRRNLLEYRGRETVGRNGKKIHLYANIGEVGDVSAVLENDAEGIGLLRSEFLYLKKDDYPSEEEQFQAYRQVVERMEGKKVIIRTMDIGADKKADYFQLDEEENPAMGYRAIRISLTNGEVLSTQLRAIYRAAVYGNVAVMFPMITSLWEIQKIKKVASQVQSDLDAEGICFGKVELGIMIETPAAVMISDLLAQEVDFFSIGTNDLIQYTLAVDRQNPKLDAFFDRQHEAVLRMIRLTVENAHQAGIRVGICGESAGDTAMTALFLEMGIDELSMAPAKILEIRKKIIEDSI